MKQTLNQQMKKTMTKKQYRRQMSQRRCEAAYGMSIGEREMKSLRTYDRNRERSLLRKEYAYAPRESAGCFALKDYLF